MLIFFLSLIFLNLFIYVISWYSVHCFRSIPVEDYYPRSAPLACPSSFARACACISPAFLSLVEIREYLESFVTAAWLKTFSFFDRMMSLSTKMTTSPHQVRKMLCFAEKGNTLLHCPSVLCPAVCAIR